MGVPMEIMRMLVRHQWVREHGTPRVSVFVGQTDRAAEWWTGWLGLSGRVPVALTSSLERALDIALGSPREPVGVAFASRELARWMAGASDRERALAAEGMIELRPAQAIPRVRRAASVRRRNAMGTNLIDSPRSLAELTIFEALEATPSTAGRFRLNQRLPVRFGNDDVEVDLLARANSIAIEIDGAHHFGEPDAYRRDRRKDLLLQAHGFAVLRFLAEDALADPEAVVQSVVNYMGQKLRRESPR